MNLRLLIVLACALLATGCGKSAETERAEREKRKEERAAQAESKLNAPLGVRVHQTDKGEVLSIAVPYKDEFGFVKLQPCFVWRDKEFKTSTLSCAAEPAM